MDTTTTPKVLPAGLLTGGMSFETYWQQSQDLYAQGRSTSDLPEFNTPEILDYVKVNLARSRRVLATTKLTDKLRAALSTVSKPQRWVLLSESWCGDASQLVPAIHLMAQENPLIKLEIYLRDQHPALMDLFLTNGGKSIPKLVVLNAETLEILGTWGPRPAEAQTLLLALKAEGKTHEEYAERIHAWYAADKTKSLQAEFAQAIPQWVAKQGA